MTRIKLTCGSDATGSTFSLFRDAFVNDGAGDVTDGSVDDNDGVDDV